MPSLTTVYRAIVMIVTGVIVVKGWQVYGPSNEQVKTFAVAALEKAQAALRGSEGESATPAAAADPRSVAPPIVASPVPPLPAESAPQLVPLVGSGADARPDASETTSPVPSPVVADSESNVVTTLLSRLQELGGADAQVAPWGSSGQLYRCCCRAKLAQSSPLARHFEAVAGEPTAAVEQVVAKVQAWRTEQQNLLR
jgi:hypothetical protein